MPDPTPPTEVIPKSKEEWEKLSQENPTQWIKLTQPRMDQAIREGREAREKAIAAETKAKNLEAEIANLKKIAVPPPSEEPKPFSVDNLPETNEEWDQLFIEDPKLATDLRVAKATKERESQDRNIKFQGEFAEARKKSAKDLWDRHPDMYVSEVDVEGKTKMDAQGKPVLKIDPNTGGPILNVDSEKGKLFVEVYADDQIGYDSAKTGPRLAMLEMERRLRDKASSQVASQGGSGAAVLDQRGTIPGGVPPPAIGKVSFTSDEEKAHAERAVTRGIYKSLDEYCQLRDGKSTGIVEENRTPQFGK